MEFKAFKMDGLGNDFIIIDLRHGVINLTKEQIIKICDRKFLGCDQLVLINKSKDTDAKLDFYNSDGSEAAACGNGTRCAAYFISNEKDKKEVVLTTKSGKLNSKVLGPKLVETVIGKARTNWKEIPTSREVDTKNLGLNIQDKQKNIIKGGTAVNVGNPHTIFFVNDLGNYDLGEIGPRLENDNLFPDRCNITIAKIIDRNKIAVKVWERGAGLTKACGSAACATAFAAKINNLVNDNVDIVFDLGNLSISIDENNFVKMKGPVSNIKKIEINLR